MHKEFMQTKKCHMCKGIGYVKCDRYRGKCCKCLGTGIIVICCICNHKDNNINAVERHIYFEHEDGLTRELRKKIRKEKREIYDRRTKAKNGQN